MDKKIPHQLVAAVRRLSTDPAETKGQSAVSLEERGTGVACF
jgi:hypothetical protein